MRKIKVLVITHTFPTKHNPVAAIFLLNQLKELKRYCDIKVIFPYAYVPKIKTLNPYLNYSDVPSKERIEGIEVYHPKYFMFPRVGLVHKFLNIFAVMESIFSYFSSREVIDHLMRGWKPDVIHLHGTVSEGMEGIRAKREYRKPLLITTYGEDITKYAKLPVSGSVSKRILKEADAIICQSHFLKREIEALGIHKPFFIIPMGALISHFRPENKTLVRKRLHIPVDKKIILFVGHLVARKGAEYLIRAMDEIIRKEKDAQCYIIGKGPLGESLRELAKELHLTDQIIFLGQKEHKEVAQYMKACDVFVLPSLNEGLPVVVCEALACGKPVVATRVAGTPELVDKDVGYLVEPKDVKDLAEKITLALNRKWETKKLLKRAKEFSVPASAQKVMGVYERFVRR